MFSHITWHDYCLYTGYAIIVYYILVIGIYYRHDLIAALLKSKKSKDSKKPPLKNNSFVATAVEENGNTHYPFEQSAQTEALVAIEQLTGSITEVVAQFGEAANKEALIQRLQAVLSESHRELIAPFKEQIEWHLLQQVQLYNSITLSESDLKKIMEGANPPKKDWKPGAMFLLAILFSLLAQAQDGNAGIQEATGKVKSYFATGCNLMYAVGAVAGLVGAVKVFNKWNSGDPDTSKVAASWFGSCIFLVVVATVLKSFFGI